MINDIGPGSIPDKVPEDLLAFCRRDGMVICPRCTEMSVYPLKDGRFRCAGCAYTFHDFTGRWINRCKMQPSQWMDLIRLFVDGIPVKKMAAKVRTSYETTLKAVNTLRLSILAADPTFWPLLNTQGDLKTHCRKGHGEHDDHCLGEHAPVFGLQRYDGKLFFQHLPKTSVKDTLSLPLNKQVWKTLVYTDRYQDFDALFFACCSHLRRLFAGRWSSGPIFLDNDVLFWNFAENWLPRYRCFTPKCCPLYLKELEFRFNHPKASWHKLLTQRLCEFVPNPR
ncbi:transposase [Desulfonatronum thioautotrophicum]|uniref:transposase n=1 Tax=Desulfonatronum thioautotrophicum TaxID=617001 RepID=UPI0005EB108E|nr:transposase [Desulfonatronum thioautotrophicum]